MAQKINIGVDINVNEKNAQAKINKLQAGLATFSGMKAEIKADIVGGDKAAKRLDELLDKFSKVRKIAGEKVNLFDLNSLKQAGKTVDTAIKSATGSAKKNLLSLQNDINETLNLIQGRVNSAAAQRAAQRSTLSFEGTGKYWNEQRRARMQQIEEGLITAKQTGDFKEQISLLREKVKLLEKIDKFNKAKTANPEIEATRKEIDAVRQKAAAVRTAQQQQERAARAAEAATKRLADLQAKVANTDRQRLDNQKMTVNGNLRMQNEIRLMQIKLGYLRQIDMLQNGGKASKATLAAESQLRNLQHTNSLLQQQGGILGRLKGLAQQYLSIFAVWNFGKKIVETTGYFEQQKVSLEGILGSAADAEKAFTRMQKMALNSPFELKDIVGQTKQAAAYGIGDGDTKKLLDDVKMLGDLSAGLGVDMQRLILAYGQVKAAAVLRGQELRQFTEAGIPMVQALADKFTQLNGKLVTTGEVFELISKRQVSFEMVASVMRDMTAEGGKFNEMQEKITETLYGQVQKLKDMWTQALNTVGSGMSGVLMKGVKVLQSLTKNIGSITKGGLFLALYASAKKLSAAIVVLEQKLISSRIAWKQMQTNMASAGVQMNVLTKAAYRANMALSSLKSAGLSLVIGALVALVTSLSQAHREFKSKMGDIANSFQKDINNLTVGLDSLISKINTFEQGTKAYNDAVDTLKSNYSDFVSDAMINQIESERNAIEKTTLSWNEYAGAIKRAIQVQKDFERSVAEVEAASNYVQQEVQQRQLWGGDVTELIRGSIWNTGLATEYGYQKGGGKGFQKIRDEILNGNTQKYIAQAFSAYTASGLGGFDEFAKAMKSISISNETVKDFLNDPAYLKKIFDEIEKTDGYKELTTAQADKEANPLYQIANAFEKAQADAANLQQGRFRGSVNGAAYRSAASAESKEYNPLTYELARQGLLVGAAKGQIERITGGIAGDMQNLFALENGSVKDLGQTKLIADYINELINSEGIKEDAQKVMELNKVLETLAQTAGTVSGKAAQVSKDFENLFKGENSAQMEDFFKKYMPTDQTFDAMVKTVTEQRDSLAKWLEDNRKWANDKGAKGEEYRQNKKEKEWLDIIWGGDKRYGNFYAQSEKKKGGGAGSKPRLANFLNDLLTTVVNADKDVKKIAQVTGYTGAMTDFVGGLKDKNILKEFFKKGANPFQNFFDEMSKYGITQDMVPGLNANVVQTIMKEVGWEEGKTMELPDFEKMYGKILEFFEKEVYPKITDQHIREQVGKAIGDWNLRSPFGRNEIEDNLRAMVSSLENIEKYSERDSRDRSHYERLAKAGGTDAAHLSVYGSDWQTYDRRDVARKTLSDLLAANGGSGMLKTAVGGDLMGILNNGASLNIQNLKMLNDAKMRIQEQQNVLLKQANAGDEAAKAEVEQFTKVAKMFDKAISDMTESIIKAYEDLPRGEIERTSVAIDNFIKQFKQNDADIKRAGGVNQNERILENTKQLYDNISKQLGGTGYLGFGGADKFTDVGLQAFYGAALGKMNLQQFMSNKIARGLGLDGSASEQDIESAAERARDIKAALEVADAIVKFTDGAIQNLGNAVKSVTKSLRSFNKIRGKADENGYMRFETTFDEHTLQMFEASAEAAMTFSQHISGAFQKFMTLDVVGGFSEIISAFADMISSINGMIDKGIQNSIEDLIESNKSLDKSISNADFLMKHQSGIDAMNTRGTKIADYLEKSKNSEKTYQLEESKKAGDQEQARKFKDESEEYMHAAMDEWQAMKQEIIGTADELSSTLTDAFVNAFKNGTNAARDWASAVKQYIGQVLQTMLLEKVIAPKVQAVLDEWMGGTDEEVEQFADKKGMSVGDYILQRLGDEKAGKEAQRQLYALGDEMTDIYSNFGQWTKDMIAFNADTSSLGSGLQGMTEDTARTLEGLGNSILMQHVFTNQKLDEIKQLPFAQVQTSWFKDIQVQTQAIATATTDMRNAIADMRNGVKPLAVTMS